MLAAAATVTDVLCRDVIHKLDMDGCKVVSVSPNKCNIFYSVCERSSLQDDFSLIFDDLLLHAFEARRVIVYCRSLNMRSALLQVLSINVITGFLACTIPRRMTTTRRSS